MNVITSDMVSGGCGSDDHLFENIANDILQKGYSINPGALPHDLADKLWAHVTAMKPEEFKRAGVGRNEDHAINDFIRTDEVCWITSESEAGSAWLEWIESFQSYINRRLLLGLFSYESHFAHYEPGDYYKKHLDAFKGESNRVLTTVVYLNPEWLPEDGGELVIYLDDQNQNHLKVMPTFGTMIVFLSEEYVHEVLPANRERFSIAGWFRINSSTAQCIDPPQ